MVFAPPVGSAATPQCSGGVVYDDGGFPAFYLDGTGSHTLVMLFDLPAGTRGLDQACFALSRYTTEAADFGIEVVIYDDDGAAGGPGTLLATVPAMAEEVPQYFSYRWVEVDVSAAGIELPDEHVYVGVHVVGRYFLGGDNSLSSPLRRKFHSTDQGVSWVDFATLDFSPGPTPRSLGIRVDATPSSGHCSPDDTTLCLRDRRFEVAGSWQTATKSGDAGVIGLTAESGLLWFFQPTNIETVVKVLDGCGVNSRYWFFAAGLTNVRVELTVTDTRSGDAVTYTNPLGHPFMPILDTAAFATCP